MNSGSNGLGSGMGGGRWGGGVGRGRNFTVQKRKRECLTQAQENTSLYLLQLFLRAARAIRSQPDWTEKHECNRKHKRRQTHPLLKAQHS